MENKEKTKEELIEEIELLRRRITELEKSESDCRKAEEALVEERNLFRTIIDNLPDYIYIKDTDSRYIVSNKAHARFLGKETPEGVIGRTVFELFPRELAENYAADDQKIIKKGQPLLIREEHSVDPRGNKVWNLTTKVPLRDSDGKVVGLVGIARDITERKKMDSKLRESENKYRTLLENLPQKIFFKDRDSVYISCNENYARDLNIKPDEITGKTDYNFFPRELAEKYRADDKKIMESGKIEHIEEDYIQDGQKVFVHTVKTPVRDENGDVVGILGIFWDITERKKMEEALRESEERYRTLVQNVPIAVYRTTPGAKGKFLMGNPAFFKMFGLGSEEELKKIAVADVHINPKNRKPFSDNLLAKGRVDGVELPLRRKDGTIFWGSVTARVVYDENGKNPYFDCTIIDITDRKRAEGELKKRMRELETFQKVAVGRELKMVELKKRIKELEASLIEK